MIKPEVNSDADPLACLEYDTALHLLSYKVCLRQGLAWTVGSEVDVAMLSTQVSG
jgi:hypothetical protein